MAFYLDKFIPKNVVTAFVNEKLRNELVFSNLVTPYDPKVNIARGASYVVPSVGSISVSAYDGTDISMQNATDTGVSITVDQANYFNFAVDKVDSEEQAKDLMPLYVDEAAYALADSQDAWIASMLASGAGLTNTDIAGTSAAISIDESTIIDYMRQVKVAMDLNNAPKQNRFIVLPAFAAGFLAQSNVETASTTSEEARLAGYVQRYFDFDIYMSNNLVEASSEYTAIAGVASASKLIQTVQDIEFYTPEARFGSASKGLNVYGGAVTNANAIVASLIKA